MAGLVYITKNITLKIFTSSKQAGNFITSAAENWRVEITAERQSLAEVKMLRHLIPLTIHYDYDTTKL